MRGRTVSYAVWDPNGVNPYGAEIARLLHEEQTDLTVWRTRRSQISIPARSHDWLSRSVVQDGLVRAAVLRLSTPIAFIVYCVFTKRVPFILWARGQYEVALFALFAMFVPLVFVYHNPDQSRYRTRIDRCSTAWLLSCAACVVVHSQKYLRNVHTKRGFVSFVPHPPYDTWLRSMMEKESDRETRGSGSAIARAVFIGEVRADKGLSHLPRILASFPDRGIEISIVGFGANAIELSRQFGDHERVRFVVSQEPLPDSTIAFELSRADVLIAPYVSPTQSGTVNLAFTARTPTLAYRGGGMSELLTDDALCDPDPDELLRLVLDWHQNSWNTYRSTPDDVRRECVSTLSTIRSCLEG